MAISKGVSGHYGLAWQLTAVAACFGECKGAGNKKGAAAPLIPEFLLARATSFDGFQDW